jgi:hypothetical protein
MACGFLIEPRLRGFNDVLVFPALDAALVGRCALILERAHVRQAFVK